MSCRVFQLASILQGERILCINYKISYGWGTSKCHVVTYKEQKYQEPHMLTWTLSVVCLSFNFNIIRTILFNNSCCFLLHRAHNLPLLVLPDSPFRYINNSLVGIFFLLPVPDNCTCFLLCQKRTPPLRDDPLHQNCPTQPA